LGLEIFFFNFTQKYWSQWFRRWWIWWCMS